MIKDNGNKGTDLLITYRTGIEDSPKGKLPETVQQVEEGKPGGSVLQPEGQRSDPGDSQTGRPGDELLGSEGILTSRTPRNAGRKLNKIIYHNL